MSHKESVDPQRGYDLWADSYDDTENPIVALDDRVVGELLGPLEGLRILDAGCGTGRHTVRLAAAAAHVVGLDFSERMLAVARAKLRGSRASVDLRVHDLQRAPYPLADGSVDGALSALVGEHLDDLDAVFGELARVVRAEGWLVFSVYHPSLAERGKEANFTGAGGVEYRLGAARHTVGDYTEALERAGFAIELRTEALADDGLVRAVPKAAKYLGEPILLVFRATRAPDRR